ncbi:hypothetical protein DFJ74DRAFT_254830 [Hyaloraphidium curvatum]|nr:hypothetical protein DFJ74DRAFT_254830 [Hyaloraphidium curvatum]
MRRKLNRHLSLQRFIRCWYVPISTRLSSCRPRSNRCLFRLPCGRLSPRNRLVHAACGFTSLSPTDAGDRERRGLPGRFWARPPAKRRATRGGSSSASRQPRAATRNPAHDGDDDERDVTPPPGSVVSQGSPPASPRLGGSSASGGAAVSIAGRAESAQQGPPRAVKIEPVAAPPGARPVVARASPSRAGLSRQQPPMQPQPRPVDARPPGGATSS